MIGNVAVNFSNVGKNRPPPGATGSPLDSKFPILLKVWDKKNAST
jgi:hypothetical protein